MNDKSSVEPTSSDAEKEVLARRLFLQGMGKCRPDIGRRRAQWTNRQSRIDRSLKEGAVLGQAKCGRAPSRNIAQIVRAIGVPLKRHSPARSR
jgi:hypothetical protein